MIEKSSQGFRVKSEWEAARIASIKFKEMIRKHTPRVSSRMGRTAPQEAHSCGNQKPIGKILFRCKNSKRRLSDLQFQFLNAKGGQLTHNFSRKKSNRAKFIRQSTGMSWQSTGEPWMNERLQKSKLPIGRMLSKRSKINLQWWSRWESWYRQTVGCLRLRYLLIADWWSLSWCPQTS